MKYGKKLNFKDNFLNAAWQNITALISGALLVCCYLSAYISPNYFWFPALLALACPLLFIINLIVLIWLTVKKRRLAIFSAFVILINVSKIGDFVRFFESPSSLQANASHIKVISWNVHNMQAINRSSQTFGHSMLSIIDSIKPDIICLQEYYDQTNRRKDLSDSIKAVTGIKYHYFQRLKNNYTGIAIFSRFPIVNQAHLKKQQTPTCDQCIFADVLVDKKNYRIYNVHLQSYFLSFNNKELSLSARIKSILGKLKVGLKKRSKQADELSSAIAQSPYPVIFTGDFNDTPLSYTYKKLSQGLNNTFREKGLGYGKTYIGLPFPIQIDYILASPQFKTLSYQTVKQQPSDHYPVIADLSF